GLLMGGWHSFAHYRRQRAILDVIRTYAQKGETPPAALMSALTADEDGAQYGRHSSPAHYWSLFGLFAVLAVGFGIGSWLYDFEGVGWPFGIVALVMGAVAVWALINAWLFRSPPAP